MHVNMERPSPGIHHPLHRAANGVGVDSCTCPRVIHVLPILHRVVVTRQDERAVLSSRRYAIHEAYPLEGEWMASPKIRNYAVVQGPRNAETQRRGHLKASKCACTIWARRSPSRMRHDTMYQLRSRIRAVFQLRIRTCSAKNRREG